MSAAYRTAERPEVWLPASIGRPSLVKPVARCFYPAFALVPVALFLSIYWPAFVTLPIAAVGVVGTLALLIDRLVYRSEVVRDHDGRFRLRRAFVTSREILSTDVAAVVFHQGLRPELVLHDGSRVPLVWSPALDELIHVSPATREAPPARIERRDYYREARLMARIVGGEALLGYAWAKYLAALAIQCCTSDHLQALWYMLILGSAFVISRLAVAYGTSTEVRYLDGRRARRWLGRVWFA